MSIDTQLSDREKKAFLAGFAKGWYDQTCFLKGWSGDVTTQEAKEANTLKIRLDQLVYRYQTKLGLETSDANFEKQILDFEDASEKILLNWMSDLGRYVK